MSWADMGVMVCRIGLPSGQQCMGSNRVKIHISPFAFRGGWWVRLESGNKNGTSRLLRNHGKALSGLNPDSKSLLWQKPVWGCSPSGFFSAWGCDEVMWSTSLGRGAQPSASLALWGLVWVPKGCSKARVTFAMQMEPVLREHLCPFAFPSPPLN